MHVAVIVLGDLGRSPRMQYHTCSLQNMTEVDMVSLIGYEGEDCVQTIKESKKVSVHRLTSVDKNEKKSIVTLFKKGFGLIFKLVNILSRLPKMDVIIIQNPPCIPAVIAAIYISLFQGSVLCLDWHNLGYTMFSDKFSKSHPIVILSRLLEYMAAQYIDYHICVSHAMSKLLKDDFLINTTVLHDQPPSTFLRNGPTITQRHDILKRLNLTDEILFPNLIGNSSAAVQDPDITIQTCHILPTTTSSSSSSSSSSSTSNTGAGSTTTSPMIDDKETTTTTTIDESYSYQLRPDRAAIVISSTSWSADEDFSVLVNVLAGLNKRLEDLRDRCKVWQNSGSTSGTATEGRAAPIRVVFLITGKGPLKERSSSK